MTVNMSVGICRDVSAVNGFTYSLFEATEYNPLVEIAQELEKHALDDEYFTEQRI